MKNSGVGQRCAVRRGSGAESAPLELTVPAELLNPDHTFSCGQTFRFHQEGDRWYGIAYGSLLEIVREGRLVRMAVHGSDRPREAWRRYFDLDCDYAALFREADPVLKTAVGTAPGLRVLTQEPFEMLISCILSANNNIPRITRIVEALCTEAGREFIVEGRTLHAFPEPEQLAGLNESRLRALGTGYRAPYILASAERAAADDLTALRDRPTPEVLAHLQTYPGVGPKVAGCIALFALGKRDAFPADVWIRRIVRELYGFNGPPAALQAFATRQFGENAGIAQQFLFHYARRHLRAGS